MTTPPSAPGSGSDRQTHTTHTINLPYRDERTNAPRPPQPEQPRPREACPQHGHQEHQREHQHGQHQHHSREPPKITPIPRISATNNLTTDAPSPSSSTPAPPPASSDAAPPQADAAPQASSDAAPTPTEEEEEPSTSTSTSSSTAPDDSKPTVNLAEGLEGKCVDEFGNILDWDGTVLGRVEGDLPSMIGRPVSDSGDIHDETGEVVGQVSENYAQQQREEEERKSKIPPLRNMDDGMRVDAAGNIYNAKGDVVGRLNEPPPPPPQQEKSSRRPGENDQRPCSCREPDRAAAAAPNPSEIYLDVKSTYDGIQLIIKIPTIFNRDLVREEN